MSRRTRILIVGVGSIGERHLRCFAATGRAELSLCELNPALREAIARRYEIAHAFDDFDQGLAARPAAVVICTPAHLHIPLAIRTARAGAHLLIEKPLSTQLAGIDQLRQELAAGKLTAAVAYVYRAHPALAAMREAIAAGRFGQPVEIVASGGQNFPYYRPAYRETYYTDRATGGGAVQDALTHVIDAGQWLVGPVDRLVADVDHKVLSGVAVEDTAHVLARHGQTLGSYSLNQHQAPNESTITVVCTEGTARFEYHRSRWSWMTDPGGQWHEECADPLERDTLFIRQAEAFLDAMEGRRPPLCSLDEGLQALRVNLAILRSAAQGTWQTIGATRSIAS